MSVRAALGASRWRLIKASLVESLLLALGGVVPGLAFAYWGSSYMARFMWQGYVPLALSLTPDTRVVLFTICVAVAAAVLFGIVPAWRAALQDPGAAIQQASSRVVGRMGLVGPALVTVQIALSFAILAGALLLARSLGNILRSDPGFNPNRLLVAQLFPRTTYAGVDKPVYMRHLLKRLERYRV